MVEEISPDWIGQFVVADADLGIGRLTQVGDNGEAEVQYFRCPAPSPFETRFHPVDKIRLITLPTQTRVYIPRAEGWIVGRVDGENVHSNGRCLVALPNSDGCELEVSDFEIRWNLPIENPFEIIEVRGGESPTVCDQRTNLLAGWHRQRSASTGAEGLFLGSVDLHDHQLSVVRRVASDSTGKYLLADEVGLGKTIEAAALVCQHLDQHPDSRVLILAPEQIRAQWAAELKEKFFIDRYHSAWIKVLAHSDTGSWPKEPVDVLVVDEAHHFTRAGNPTEATVSHLTELAHNADQVLLLSATPVRSNEAGFLDLLHLVDPEHYGREDLEQFTELVEARDALAHIHQALTPALEPIELTLFGDDLKERFPGDTQLAELLTAAEMADNDSRANHIGQVREHLSEAYRIHHRLLRTRRHSEIGSSLFVRGRRRGSPFTIEIEDESDARREQLLNGFRFHLAALVETNDVSEKEAVEVFRDVADRCGSSPQAILAITASTTSGQATDTASTPGNAVFDAWVSGDGRSYLASIEAVVDQFTERLARELCDQTLARQQVKKAVVFSSFTETAQSAAVAVREMWSSERVAVHLKTASREENAESMSRWLTDDHCKLLFCDRSAEEGLNLQSSDVLIHLDLPWESSRLEQRIGRCDRYVGRTTDPIPSVIIAYGYQPFARNWFAFLADGCRVFDESISSLQYVLADTEAELHMRVLSEGSEVLDEVIDQQAEKLKSELQIINNHDALDSFDSDHDAANSELLDCDHDPSFTRALTDWLEGVNVRVRSPSLDDPGVKVFRQRNNARPQVPLALEQRMGRWFEKRVAVTREATVEHGHPILRAGNELVDAIASHLLNAERGVAFAFLRPRPQWPPFAAFRVDLLVHSGPNTELCETAASLGLESWVRREIQARMPPVLETIFFTPDGVEQTSPLWTKPYDQERDVHLASQPDLFARITSELDWKEFCDNGPRWAESLINQRPTIAERPLEAADTLRQEISRRTGRMVARHEADLPIDGRIDLTELVNAVPHQLEYESQILGCGVIFVGRPPVDGS